MEVGAKVALAGLQSEETGFPGVPATDAPVLMAQQPQWLIGTHQDKKYPNPKPCSMALLSLQQEKG